MKPTEDRCTECGSSRVDETGDTIWESCTSTLYAFCTCHDCGTLFTQVYSTEFFNAYTEDEDPGHDN